MAVKVARRPDDEVEGVEVSALSESLLLAMLALGAVWRSRCDRD